MTMQTERQRRVPRAMNRLVSMLATLDHLTTSVMAVPTGGRDRRAASGEPADVPPTSGVEDDLANATWEDAEWR